MKVEKIEPKTVTYKLTPDSDSDEYAFCMWSRFILDYDSWRLTINSDAGDYTYCWGNNDNNDNFTSLMARVNEEYLLNKMANRSRFYLDESKKATVKTIEQNGFYCFGIKGEQQWREIEEQIYEIDEGASAEQFFREVESIVPSIDFECIEVIKDYPSGAYTVIGLFIKYVQPLLKEEWSKLSK